MRKAVVGFATLGVSPMVVTEFVDGYSKVTGKGIDELVIIYTSDPEVSTCYKALCGILGVERPKIKIKGLELPYSDLDSENSVLDFICRVSKEMRRYSGAHRTCCIAGGRKNMSTMLSLLAQHHGIGEVYHIISPNIKNSNLEYEQLKNYVRRIGEASDPKEEYQKVIQEAPAIRDVFFPPAGSYSLVRIPILPYSPHYLGTLVQSLLKNDLKALSGYELDCLESAGFIQKVGGGYALTNYGKKFLNAILGRCEEGE